MTEKWKDTGARSSVVGTLVQNTVVEKVFGKSEAVVNTETGETKSVYVAPGQTVGEAIAKGQFNDKPTSEWKR